MLSNAFDFVDTLVDHAALAKGKEGEFRMEGGGSASGDLEGGEVASLGSGEEVHQGGAVELDMGEEPFGKDEWKAGKSGSNTVVQGLDIAFNTGSMMRRRRGSEDDRWCKESKAIDQREEAMFSIDVNSAHFMTKGAIHADDINYAKEEVIRGFGLGNCDVKAAAEFINSSDDLGVATCRWDTEQLDIQGDDFSYLCSRERGGGWGWRLARLGASALGALTIEGFVGDKISGGEVSTGDTTMAQGSG